MAKSDGTVRSSAPVRFLFFLFVVIVLIVGGAYFLLYSATHPPRDKTRLDPADLLLRTKRSRSTPPTACFCQAGSSRERRSLP